MTVLVGVDGSGPSLDAVELATREALWHGTDLRIVHAFAWPYLHVSLGPSEIGPPEGGLRNAAQAIVNEAAERARAVLKDQPRGAGNTTIEVAVIDGFATATLLAEGERAEMIVVGDRGLGGFTGLLIGSVAVQLAAHATRPVLIQRGRRDPTGPIVVGVDGTATNEAAIEFAFAEAAARGASLTALSVWSHPESRGPGEILPLVYDAGLLEDEARKTLSAAVAQARLAHPEVEVYEELARGRPRRLLTDASNQAQLVVVGTRGRGAVEGLVLGSVSQTVMRRSSCAVAIVPDGRGSERTD